MLLPWLSDFLSVWMSVGSLRCAFSSLCYSVGMLGILAFHYDIDILCFVYLANSTVWRCVWFF